MLNFIRIVVGLAVIAVIVMIFCAPDVKENIKEEHRVPVKAIITIVAFLGICYIVLTQAG